MSFKSQHTLRPVHIAYNTVVTATSHPVYLMALRTQTNRSSLLAQAAQELRAGCGDQKCSVVGPSVLSIVLRCCREETASLILLGGSPKEALRPFPGAALV